MRDSHKSTSKSELVNSLMTSLAGISQTQKFKDISLRQDNILTIYNYEAAFALARQRRRTKIVGKGVIEGEQEKELEEFVSTLIEIKLQEKAKFRAIVESLINVLSSDTVAIETRMRSMRILRKLSNYKHNSRVNDSIQHDLLAMGFLHFLCDVIIVEQDALMKLEYIKGLIDFMDEGNREI